jgi:hypothetical protein
MGLFGKTITVGNEKLSVSEFVSRLEKGEGIYFKRIDKKSPAIGPTATATNNIIGDMLAVETTFFIMNCSEDQRKLFGYLQNHLPSESYRYLLVISNSTKYGKKT